MPRPKVLVLAGGKLQQQLFPAKVRQALAEFADPTYNPGDQVLSADELALQIADYDAIIPCWGAPKLTPDLLDKAARLRIVAHAAGSVHFLLPDPPSDFFRRGIKLTTATPMMSRYVAELTLCLIIACLRRISRFREEMKGADLWWGTHHPLYPDTLFDKRVGIVGLGMISWELIRLLKPFDCEIWAYSKHADPKRAEGEGLTLVDLDQLLANCPIICLLAAVRPDTIRMIDRRRLALMHDGAVLVNTARGALVDEEALIEEVRKGRLWVGLDVTDPEPPAPDSPLRTLPNVLLTPHVGGPTPSRYWDMASYVVEDLRRFFTGRPLEGEVTEGRLEGMA